MTEKEKAVQAFKEQDDLVRGNPTAINNLKQSEKENLMPGITAWLNDPKNKNNPYYDQVLSLYNQQYSGVGVSPLDGFFGLFGPTAYDKQHSEWSSKLSAGWQELLAKISEYDTNLPANLALLNKQAGYNTDLAGSPGEQMNMNDESPIEGLSTGDLGSGLENFEKIGSGLMSIVSSAFAFYKSSLDISGLKLDNKSKAIANDNATIAGEKSALGVSNDIYDDLKKYTLHFMQENGLGSLNGKDYNIDISFDDFVKSDWLHNDDTISALRRSVSDFADSTYDDISFSRISRALSRVKSYIGSAEFHHDLYDLYKNRQNSFKDMTQSLIETGGLSSNQPGAFEVVRQMYEPLYKLQMSALEGDYTKRSYDGKSAKLSFDKKKFDYDLASTARNMMTGLKESADSGDAFARSLLFTMTADPTWFSQLNTIFGGIKDIVEDFNPLNFMNKVGKGTKAPIYVKKTVQNTSNFKIK